MTSMFGTALVLVVAMRLVGAQDITPMLNNVRIVNRQIDCILERNNHRCDVIGRQIKAVLPDALHNECRQCSVQHKAIATQLTAFMVRKYPNEWSLIQRKYPKASHHFLV